MRNVSRRSPMLQGCCREKAHGVTVLYVYLKLEHLSTLKKFVIQFASTLIALFFLLDKEYSWMIDRRDSTTSYFRVSSQHTRTVCLPADSQQRRDVQTSQTIVIFYNFCSYKFLFMVFLRVYTFNFLSKLMTKLNGFIFKQNFFIFFLFILQLIKH